MISVNESYPLIQNDNKANISSSMSSQDTIFVYVELHYI
jgi:hypothetical protein